MIQVGPYTVQLRQEPGHQCPLYRVYLGSVLIGKCISVPDEDACRWLERQQREQTFYAYSSAKLPEYKRTAKGPNITGHRRGKAYRHYPKRGGKRKPERPQDIAKALAGG